MEDRRASRAWRLSPHGVASVDAEQHRAQRAGRQKTWAADAEPSGRSASHLTTVIHVSPLNPKP